MNVISLLQNNPILILAIGGAIVYFAWFYKPEPAETVDDLAAGTAKMPKLSARPQVLVPTVDEGMEAIRTISKILRANGWTEEENSAFVKDTAASLLTAKR